MKIDKIDKVQGHSTIIIICSMYGGYGHYVWLYTIIAMIYMLHSAQSPNLNISSTLIFNPGNETSLHSSEKKSF